jgi:hypothetical protein
MGIRTYKEWPCATGDSTTYFVTIEPEQIPSLFEFELPVKKFLEEITNCSPEGSYDDISIGYILSR